MEISENFDELLETRWMINSLCVQMHISLLFSSKELTSWVGYRMWMHIVIVGFYKFLKKYYLTNMIGWLGLLWSLKLWKISEKNEELFRNKMDDKVNPLSSCANAHISSPLFHPRSRHHEYVTQREVHFVKSSWVFFFF